MLGVLTAILNAVKYIGALLLVAVVTAINKLVVAIGAALAGAMSLLPNLPDVPSLGSTVSSFTWLFPMGPLAAVFASFVTMWVTFLGVAVLLRWLKGI